MAQMALAPAGLPTSPATIRAFTSRLLTQFKARRDRQHPPHAAKGLSREHGALLPWLQGHRRGLEALK